MIKACALLGHYMYDVKLAYVFEHYGVMGPLSAHSGNNIEVRGVKQVLLC